MKVQIAIIATDFLRKFLDKALKDVSPDMEYTIYAYRDFEDIPRVYGGLPDSVKGVITSGIFPTKIIQENFPDTRKVIRTISNDDVGIYRMFLELLEKDRSLDLNRIYADFMEVIQVDLREYLFGDTQICYGERLEEKLRNETIEDLMAAENRYREKHIRLWKEGSTDISATRFSSIAESLAEEGIPVCFPYPGYEHIRAVCLETLQEIRIREMKGNQPASILVSSPNHEEQVEKGLARFNTVHRMGADIRHLMEGYEVLTRRSVIEEITEHYTSCKMQDFFMDRKVDTIYVGYGLGEELNQARVNAVDAHREARRIAGGGSAVINENNELIVPLSREVSVVVPRQFSDRIRHIAQCSGLSQITVQKVAGAVRAGEGQLITSRELSDRLAVSQRTANRFLSALMKGGFAEIKGVKQDSTMGRPERVYEVRIEG